MRWFNLPTPPTCLRLSLSPLSLGHIFLLHEFNSPFVVGGSVGTADLYLATFICSNDHEVSQRNLLSWWSGPYFWLWAKATKKLNFTDEYAKFCDYFHESSALPRIRTTRKQGEDKRKLAAPWPYRLLIILMGEIGYSEKEALDMSLLKANHLYSAHAEMHGSVEIAQKGDTLDALWEFKRQEEMKEQRN